MTTPATIDRALDSMPRGAVPASRVVPDLEAAIDLARRIGGSLVSEIRTAPGIGSWVFVADVDGGELLLWENGAPS